MATASIRCYSDTALDYYSSKGSTGWLRIPGDDQRMGNPLRLSLSRFDLTNYTGVTITSATVRFTEKGPTGRPYSIYAYASGAGASDNIETCAESIIITDATSSHLHTLSDLAVEKTFTIPDSYVTGRLGTYMEIATYRADENILMWSRHDVDSVSPLLTLTYTTAGAASTIWVPRHQMDYRSDFVRSL